jgi:UDP-glucose 4-epimerase
MKVLVTGANGFIGQEICRILVTRGIPVRAAVRSEDAFQRLPYGVEPVLVQSMDAIDGWTRASQDCSAVVHLIGMAHASARGLKDDLSAFNAVNVGITRQILGACRQNDVKQLVYMSSIKAVGEESGAAAALDENATCHPETPYGRSKREAELLISAETGTGRLQTTILRPPLVYGAAVPGNFLRLLKWIDCGVPLPLASVANQRSMIYVGNLASAAIAALLGQRADREIFHVADSGSISTPDLIRSLANLIGKPARLYQMPERLLRLGGRVVGRYADVKRLVGSLPLSTGHIESTIGWRAPYSTEEGLANTVAWYLNKG